MFGTIVRQLIDQRLTTVKEIEEVTGRGTSTIYRWINGESEPHFMDMHLLIQQMADPRARRMIVGVLTSNLPVVISWIGEDEPDESVPQERRAAGTEVLERSLVALDCLSHALTEGNEAIRRQELTKDSYIKLVSLVDETIRHLTASKNMLQRYAPVERAADSPAGPVS